MGSAASERVLPGCHVSSHPGTVPASPVDLMVALPVAQRERLRVQTLNRRKQTIAGLASAIVSNPLTNVPRTARVPEVLLSVSQ